MGESSNAECSKLEVECCTLVYLDKMVNEEQDQEETKSGYRVALGLAVEWVSSFTIGPVAEIFCLRRRS